MQRTQFIHGLILTTIVAFLARQLVQLPVLSIFGAMVTAILVGLVVRTFAEKVVLPAQPGVSFSAKYLLRAGIILMGVRLDVMDIVAAGWQTVVLDISVIIFTITLIHLLGRKFSVAQRLTSLIAVGTGVCGAAAIGAVAPVIKAKEEEVAVSVAIIALLGTVFTVAYTTLLPVLNLSPEEFGTFAGATLHEIAHVIAAAAPDGPTSSDTAILVKLGRVIFLAPVAMVLGWLYSRKEGDGAVAAKPAIPWFVFGFLGMAILNTYGLFNEQARTVITEISIWLMTIAMAGMGLNVRLSDFRRAGHNPLLICFIGSVFLSAFGRALMWALGI